MKGLIKKRGNKKRKKRNKRRKEATAMSNNWKAGHHTLVTGWTTKRNVPSRPEIKKQHNEVLVEDGLRGHTQRNRWKAFEMLKNTFPSGSGWRGSRGISCVHKEDVVHPFQRISTTPSKQHEEKTGGERFETHKNSKPWHYSVHQFLL